MFERLTSCFDQLADSATFHGIILVSLGKGVPVLRAFGLADRTWGVPHTGTTRFRVASIGKAFTAVAVWQLIESGLLALDTPLHTLLDLRDTAIPQNVTVGHLLTMTAGLADWFEESVNWAEEWARLRAEHDMFALQSNRDYLPLFAQKAPVSPVGQSYAYNNASFILLGLVLEAVRGQPYEDVIRQSVFDPTRMAQSDFDRLDDIISGTAQGYTEVQEESGRRVWRRNTYLVTPAPAADGGVTSSAPDLLLFLRALCGGVLLNEELTAGLLSGRWSVAGPGTLRGQHWLAGHGLSCSFNGDGLVTRVGLTGEEEGVSARVVHSPQLGIDLVVLSNVSRAAVQVACELHHLLTT